MLIIIGIILICIGGFVLRKAYIENNDIRNRILLQTDEELQSKIREKVQECNTNIHNLEDNYRKEKESLEKSINDNKRFLQLQEEHKQELINNEKEIVNMAVEQHREKSMAELEKVLSLREAEISQKISEYLQKEEAVKKELEDYEARQTAITEAILREKKLQEEENYYKIILSEKDMSDIQVIHNIENRLNNREAINKLIYDLYIKRPSQEMIKRITAGEKISGIYKITYLGTGEAYIGRSVDIGTRWKQHILSSLNLGTIAHSTFHNFLADKGLSNFTFEILEKVDKDKLNSREKYWISFYKTDKQLNSNVGG